jgi:hypothetical protein
MQTHIFAFHLFILNVNVKYRPKKQDPGVNISFDWDKANTD